MWIKFDSPAAWEAVYTIKPASGFDRNNIILYLNSTYFRLESSGNTGPYYDIAYNFVIGAWVHLTLVFKSSGLEDCELYIDNVRLVPLGSKRSETDDITITGTNTIYVGSDPAGYYLDGSIANFRVFNRALTTDEIYQLYAYQKEYFGHGTLGMTLKAGRLGIGTSEPDSQLHVNGVAKFQNIYYYAGASVTSNFHATGIPTYINVHRRSNGGLVTTDSGTKIQVTTFDAAGVYVVWCSVTVKTDGTQERGLSFELFKNDTSFANVRDNINHITSSTYTQLVCSGLIDLNQGDKVYSQTTSNSSFQVHVIDTNFYMYRISS